MKQILGFIRHLYWTKRLCKGEKWNSLNYSEKADFLKQLCFLVEGKTEDINNVEII